MDEKEVLTMEERENVYGESNAPHFALTCCICGERIGFEEPFYSDATMTVHLDCYFFEKKEKQK
jgi:hypothetical protein